jgi:hypothetical protein
MREKYRCLAVGKAALEGGHDHVLMLLLDDLRGCRKDPKGVLALRGVWGLACLEQGAQELRPCNA